LPKNPADVANRTPAKTVKIVKRVRLNLYNQNLFCGTQAIRWDLEELGVSPLPSLRTINRILKRNILDEPFSVPPKVKLEYVVAIIDVKE